MITSTTEAAEKLGRAEMAARIGVGLSAISAAVTEGRFRPAWYREIRAMAGEKGIQLSDDLFRWKSARKKKPT